MLIIYMYITLVCLNAYTDTKILQVVDSGVKKIEKDDMIVVFFLTIRHIGKQPRRLMATMNECCEDITENDRDCDLMDLYGGDFGLIQPGTIKNITLLYPNLYGYNRRGRCTVTVLHRDPGISEVVEISHQIEFDTRLQQNQTPPFEGSYSKRKSILCETPDLDPFDECNPVDCSLKYSGYRSFFNRKFKLCQRAPVCQTNLQKELPDIAYVPTNNECRDLEHAFNKDDLKKVVSQKYQPEPMVNIRCHHGEINPKTGFCVCNSGWKSEPYDPTLLIYSMCTIKCKKEKPDSKLVLVLGIGLAAWLIFLVCCCEWNDIFLVKRNVKSSSETLYYPREAKKCGCDATFS